MNGIPRWLLYATIPVLAALGFVVAMATRTYWAKPAARPAPAGNVATGSGDAAPTTAAPSSPGGSGMTQPAPPAGYSTPTVPSTPPGGYRATPTVPSNAYRVYQGPTPLQDSINGLNSDFANAVVAGVPLRVKEYRLMESGSRNVLVGVITVADEPRWEEAIKLQPATLAAWLEKAAQRTHVLAMGMRFEMVWSVVDVVKEKPADYAPHELVTQGGSWLAIRPLAATAVLEQTSPAGSGAKYVHQVFVRGSGTLRGAASPAPGHYEPWEVYVPTVRYEPASGSWLMGSTR